MKDELEELGDTSHREQDECAPSSMFIYYGSEPICNEHLEGQRDDLSYITAEVGTASAASRVET